MADTKLLTTGIIGAVVTVLCCFTPVLVVALSALGLGALTGLLDPVLFGLLAIFLIMIGYALWRRKARQPG